MTMKRIRVELARSKEFPDGSANHGYEVTLPLPDDDRFDTAAFKADGQLCTFVKFAAGADDRHGQLVKESGGDWAFSYQLGEADDERIFRLESHVFRPDEYVTVTDEDDEEHVYRVVSVDNLHFPGS